MAKKPDERSERERVAFQIVAAAVIILALIIGGILLIEFRQGRYGRAPGTESRQPAGPPDAVPLPPGAGPEGPEGVDVGPGAGQREPNRADEGDGEIVKGD